MTPAQPPPRGEIIQQLDGIYELFPVPTDQDTLYGILTDCPAEWERIRIGLLIPRRGMGDQAAASAQHRLSGRLPHRRFRGVAPAPVYRRTHVGASRGGPATPHRPR